MYRSFKGPFLRGFYQDLDGRDASVPSSIPVAEGDPIDGTAPTRSLALRVYLGEGAERRNPAHRCVGGGTMLRPIYFRLTIGYAAILGDALPASRTDEKQLAAEGPDVSVHRAVVAIDRHVAERLTGGVAVIEPPAMNGDIWALGR